MAKPSHKEILSWLAVVSAATKAETALLDKSIRQLYRLWRKGLSILVLDETKVIGHAALVPLIPEQNWYEFGVVWIHPEYRHKSLRLALRLYNALLGYHQDKHILATTTNPAALGVGWRAGLLPIAYKSLPHKVWRETCCCPDSKTGAPDGNNLEYCALREQQDSGCFVRITPNTYEHLQRPELIRLPISKPTTTVDIPVDNIRILLSTPP